MDLPAWFRDKRIAVVDFETTGVDPDVDRIVEVGIIDVVNGAIDIDSVFNQLFDPGMPMGKRARELCQITDSMLRGQPPLRIYLSKIVRRLEVDAVCLHNGDFDIGFLNLALEDAGLAPFYPLHLDTLDAGLQTNPERPLVRGLARLHALAGLKLPDDALFDGIGVHRAPYDAYLTAQLLCHYAAHAGELGVDSWADFAAFMAPRDDTTRMRLAQSPDPVYRDVLGLRLPSLSDSTGLAN